MFLKSVVLQHEATEEVLSLSSGSPASERRKWSVTARF